MWKNLHLCFPTNLTKPSLSPSDPSTDDPNRPLILLINNFNLLYDDSAANHRRLQPSSTTTSTSTAANSSLSSTSYDDSSNYGFTLDADSPPPDLTAVLASRRFFFSSPGRSNLITDSPDLRCRDNYDTATPPSTRFLTTGTAVKQYVQSPDPYNDFRRSMEEMLDAAVRNAGDLRRYEFLHELLLNYLSLNSADTHRFIIRAFADILVCILPDGDGDSVN